MGSSLKHPGHWIIDTPFLSKTAVLIAFADGAYPLFLAICLDKGFIKFVSVFAVRLTCINSWYRVAVGKCILSYCDQRKMLMINAPRVSTNVVNNHTRWYRAAGNKPCNPMGASTSFPKIESAVPVFVERTIPSIAAIAQYFVFLTKSVQFAFCQHAILLTALWDLSIPQGATGAKGKGFPV
jgi:hypothetical protein